MFNLVVNLLRDFLVYFQYLKLMCSDIWNSFLKASFYLCLIGNYVEPIVYTFCCAKLYFFPFLPVPIFFLFFSFFYR